MLKMQNMNHVEPRNLYSLCITIHLYSLPSCRNNVYLLNLYNSSQLKVVYDSSCIYDHQNLVGNLLDRFYKLL